MEPKEAWGSFSFVVVAGDIVAAASLYDIGVNPAFVIGLALIVPLIYFYILYKRYYVEVLQENDIMQFDDPDDLRILCSIYGLETAGSVDEMRARLLRFAWSKHGEPFAWVAPKAVLSLGQALEMQPAEARKPPKRSVANTPLPGGKQRTRARRAAIARCPVCQAPAPARGSICSKCGSDLEFYEVMGESKVGKLVLSEKAGQVRRKT
jgi:hypothetical protein